MYFVFQFRSSDALHIPLRSFDASAGESCDNVLLRQKSFCSGAANSLFQSEPALNCIVTEKPQILPIQLVKNKSISIDSFTSCNSEIELYNKNLKFIFILNLKYEQKFCLKVYKKK